MPSGQSEQCDDAITRIDQLVPLREDCAGRATPRYFSAHAIIAVAYEDA
jgi:hypothetical protein